MSEYIGVYAEEDSGFYSIITRRIEATSQLEAVSKFKECLINFDIFDFNDSLRVRKIQSIGKI